MSTVSSDLSIRTTAQQRAPLPRWVREPLLHFVILGALLFGIDQLMVSRTDDPRTIVIDQEVDKEATQVFKTARGREPNAEELEALRRVWLDNEVLYREGLALGLDKGDVAIRERVIFKALSVIDAGTKRPAFDEATLRAWFEKNRAKYDEPTRYNFQEAVLSGDASEASKYAFANALNAGTPQDVQADLRVFTGRPQSNLVQSYGPDFAKALSESPTGQWRVLASKDGPRVMRLDAVTPGKPADFEELHGVVAQDWTDATMAEQRSAVVRAWAKKYKIETARQ
jgi:hypothetical protein